jgi:hypothetical protein
MRVLDGDHDVSDAVDANPHEPWYATVTA